MDKDHQFIENEVFGYEHVLSSNSFLNLPQDYSNITGVPPQSFENWLDLSSQTNTATFARPAAATTFPDLETEDSSNHFSHKDLPRKKTKVQPSAPKLSTSVSRKVALPTYS